MNNYKFSLLKYAGTSSRFTCPSCGRNKVFVPYVNNNTGELYELKFGRCNREIKCGYHLKPDSKESSSGVVIKVSRVVPELVSMQNFMDNRSPLFYDKLSKYLLTKFDAKILGQVLSQYYVGTFGKWVQDTLFWYVTINNQIVTGKIMLYGDDGKRVKVPRPYIGWAHKEFNHGAYSCLFGEHLLTSSVGEIQVVESEKTALVCKLLFPEKTWLATGGIGNIRDTNIEVLKPFKVRFHPDKGESFTKWKEKLKESDVELDYTVSDFLESKDVVEGSDLCDYYLNKLK